MMTAGADGLLAEVHPNPETALKDGTQSITSPAFQALVHELGVIGEATGQWL